LKVAADDVRMTLRVGLLRATAHQAAGDTGAARAELQSLKSRFSANANLVRSIDRRLQQLSGTQ
jgi:hypothetical protein